MKSKTIRTALALFFISLLIAAPRAQQTTAPALAETTSEDRINLYQALLDLTNPWTVMCIAAHPDDEDGTSLIVMRRKYGAHTVSVFSTFGEGGQNAIGPELYEELGAIRARETMAAAEIQGSEPYFLGLKDFGYSKSAEEAFRFWGHEEALRRMVLQIRKLRPDVIITNHSVTNNDHGHHQATARLELEAFDAAADPKRFPEQLKEGVAVWQVQRLFVRAGRSNQAQADSAGVVTIDPNERDPIRDTTFAEEALRALQKHATQGPWPKTLADMARFRNSPDGKLPLIRYVLVRVAKGTEALAKDSHNFLDGLRLPEAVAKGLTPPTIDGRPLTDFVDDRERVSNTLVLASKNKLFNTPISTATPDEERRSMMLWRLSDTLVTANGISTKLISDDTVLIPGTTAKFNFLITNSGTKMVHVGLIWFGGGDRQRNVAMLMDQVLNSDIAPGKSVTIPLTYKTPDDAKISVPHFQHLYDNNFAGQPLAVSTFMQLEGTSFPILAHTFAEVAPEVEIADISPSPVVLTSKTYKHSITFTLRLVSHSRKIFTGQLVVEGLAGHAENFGRPLRLRPNETTSISGRFIPTLKTLIAADGTAKPLPGSVLFQILATSGSSVVTNSTVPVFYADAKVTPNLRVGYIRGFDYSLPNALAALGVESKELSVDEVKTADLQKYSAIIVDNRVYESQPGLIAANQRLLDYAKDGGTLIVFYHKSFEWNPDPRRNRPQLAPYSITLGDERITDENAPISFIEPQHPLLNFPNKIGQEDFAGWIQERGLYYPKDWDAHYQALLTSNDPGEAPLRGGLLAADYGRGHYIYTSMVWYRQLRAGVPGAYRMLANMISYGRPAR